MAVVSYLEPDFWTKLKQGSAEVIDFAGSDVTDVVLERLSELGLYLSCLTALDLTGCFDITDRGLDRLFSTRNERLQKLILAGCRQLAGGSYLSNLSNATEIDVSGCSITDDTLKELSKRLHLRTLNISGCDRVTDVGIRALFSFKGSFITTLVVRNCPLVTGSGFENTYKLRNITLSGPSVTDKTLTTLLSNDSALEALALYHCPNLKGQWIHNSRLRLGQLKKLQISSLSERLIRENLRFFKNLEELTISDSPDINDGFLRYLCIYLPKLIQLDCINCENVTEEGILKAQELLKIKSGETI